MAVTWGANTTQTFGKGTAANTTAPAPAGFTFGATPGSGTNTPSTPPLASHPAPATDPPLLTNTNNSTSAAPTPGAHGTANPVPTTFGGPQGFGLSGKPPATSAPAPSGSSLFGAPAPAPTTGGLFGSTPAPTTGLFGSTAPTSSTPSLFGSTPAPTFGSFGAQPAPQSQPQPQAPHQAAIHAHQTAAQRQETARLEEAIFRLHANYSPHAADPLNPALASNNLPSSLCNFTAILYDPLPAEYRGSAQGPLSVPKPGHISKQTWDMALAQNPDSKELMPASLVGAAALHSRIVSQQDKANSLSNHAAKLRDSLSFLAKAARASNEAISQSNSEQESLRRRTLEVMRKVEIIRCMNQPTQRAEVEANARLTEIIKQIKLAESKLLELEERGKHQSRAWRMRGATLEAQKSRDDFTNEKLSEEDKMALFNVLNDQRLGMERLGDIVAKDSRDAAILHSELDRGENGRGRSAVPAGVNNIFTGC